MKKLKVVAIIVIVLLTLFNLYFLFDSWQMGKHYDEELGKWKGAYDMLNARHDSLVDNYQVSLKNMKWRESLFVTTLEQNSLEYETIIAGFDTLSVDEHIRKLAEFISEEDSLR